MYEVFFNKMSETLTHRSLFQHMQHSNKHNVDLKLVQFSGSSSQTIRLMKERSESIPERRTNGLHKSPNYY